MHHMAYRLSVILPSRSVCKFDFLYDVSNCREEFPKPEHCLLNVPDEGGQTYYVYCHMFPKILVKEPLFPSPLRTELSKSTYSLLEISFMLMNIAPETLCAVARSPNVSFLYGQPSILRVLGIGSIPFSKAAPFIQNTNPKLTTRPLTAP